MSLQFSPYSILALITIIIALLTAHLAFQRRKAPGSKYMFWLMLAVAEWALTAGLEATVVGTPAKIFWSKISYFGIHSCAVLMLLYTVRFTQQDQWLTVRRIRLLWVIPVITMLLAVTNEWHSLIWTSFTPSLVPGSNVLIYGHGMWFWLSIAYTYLLLITVVFFMVRAVVVYRHVYRNQVIAMLFATFFPWFGNAFYVFELGPEPGWDLAPVGFALTGLILTWGVRNLQLFELVPMARESVIEVTRDCIIVLDAQNRIADINPAAFNLITILRGQDTHWSIRSCIGKSADELFELWPELLQQLGVSGDLETEIRLDFWGKEHYYDLQISAFSNNENKVIGRTLVLHEITNRKLVKQEAILSRNMAEALVAAGMALSSTLDFEEVLNQILDQIFKVVPFDYASVLLVDGSNIEVVAVRGVDNLYGVVGTKFPIMERGPIQEVVVDQCLIRMGTVQPDTLWLQKIVKDVASCLGVPILSQGKTMGLLGVYSRKEDHFTEADQYFLQGFSTQVALALQNAQMYGSVKRLAITDYLTGLYNRMHFFNLAEHEFNRAQRYNRPLSLIMLDIDHFKKINDVYGHQVGDQVLKEFGRLFPYCLRCVDIIGRYGGEEFVLLLSETDVEGARLVAERLCSCIRSAEIETTAGSLSVTVSLGVAEMNNNLRSLDELVEHADQALYAAKHEGRDQVSVYCGPA